MSRRHEIQFTPGELTEFLSQPHKAALATIDKEGFPHVVAMGYRYKDGVIYMTSYGKAQKVLNIRRNPKVSLMVEAGSAYAELKGVMVRGHCEIAEGAEAVAEVFAWMAEDRREPRPAGAIQPAAAAGGCAGFCAGCGDEAEAR